MSTRATALEFEEAGKSLRDYVNVLRRRKRLMGISAAIVIAVVIVVTFAWPKTYRSESIILIEQQDIPSNLVQTTITSYAQQRIEKIKQRIMTIGNIMEIVDEYSLHTEKERERKTRTEIAQEFREAVTINLISSEVVDPRSGRPGLAVIAFSLAYYGDVPAKVQRVTNELTTLYLNENLKDRSEQTKSTTDFLEAEAAMLGDKLEKLDGDIAKFKEENRGALPELKQFNLSVVDRTEVQISDIQFQLKELEKRKIELEGSLEQMSPTAPVVLSTGRTVLGDSDRLKALQSELRDAEASYREDHPTVLQLRREVNALLAVIGESGKYKDELKRLRVARDELSELQSRYTDEHPEIASKIKVISDLEGSLANSLSRDSEEKADNPAYVVLKTRLQATEEDIRVNSQKVVDLENKIAEHEGYLAKTPQVEKEYQRLQRDYNNTYLKYQEIRAKQMSAELASNLETEQKGERFTLIQPPELPIEPVSPNRVAWILLGAVFAGLAGLASALLREAVDEGVYGVSDITNLTGEVPLVTIRYMRTADEAVQYNRKRVYIVAGLFFLGVIAVVFFHFFVKPLDVTWYILMRKLGIH